MPHFFATHLTQALPLTGGWVRRFGVVRSHAIVVVAGIAGLAIVAGTFAQAIAARPYRRASLPGRLSDRR